jgi:calcyphosin
MDDDGNSSLVFEEFSNGIAESGLKVPPEIMRALFDQFDSDGSGSVSINEFLLAVRVSFSSDF